MKLKNILVAACALLFLSTPWAQNWPIKPIRIVIPFGPGAASDMVARRLAEKLQATLGQPVIVESLYRAPIHNVRRYS